jgi:DNA-binding response OmpR family regulator
MVTKLVEKILFIDDDKMLAETFSIILEMEGYETYIANTGKQGIKLVKLKNPNYVFIDLNMPDINGIEIVKKIKEIQMITRIFMITGHSDEVSIKNALDAGATAFLIKPIKPNDLVELLKPKK